MKQIKIISIVTVILLLSIGTIKFNYRDSSEKRGFDFNAPMEFNMTYFLIRFFIPYTTSGINHTI